MTQSLSSVVSLSLSQFICLLFGSLNTKKTCTRTTAQRHVSKLPSTINVKQEPIYMAEVDINNCCSSSVLIFMFRVSMFIFISSGPRAHHDNTLSHTTDIATQRDSQHPLPADTSSVPTIMDGNARSGRPQQLFTLP